MNQPADKRRFAMVDMADDDDDFQLLGWNIHAISKFCSDFACRAKNRYKPIPVYALSYYFCILQKL